MAKEEKKETPRQELVFKFAGKDYRIRPTAQMIANVEAATDRPCYDLGIRMLSVRAISFTEMAAIMGPILLEGGTSMRPVDIMDVFMDEGYDDLLEPIGKCLQRALRGHSMHMQEAAGAAAAGERTADPPNDSSTTKTG